MQGEAGQVRALRTRVYVDGYNFYYGALKGTRYKWLDLYALFKHQILPSILVEQDGLPAQSELLPEAIQYFTATIIESAAKAADSVSSQARYHTALRKLHDGTIRIVEGYYSLTKARAPAIDDADPKRPPRECDRVPIWKLEEKQSDVNLALHAYHDAMTGQIDQAVIVSNDTDLVPALRMIRENTGAMIGLVVPTRDHERRPNADLTKYCHWVRHHLKEQELAASQLPRVVPGGRSPTIKPDSWYPHPDLFQRALQLATKVRGGRSAAFRWFEQPSPYLGNARPLDLMETREGALRVVAYMEDWLAQQPGQEP
ncbi:antitoxin Xre/MbcA/ParS toxin-binding domain-containing protein [Cupriavidus malaysiensis]|uniref:6-hydroxy-3-succinoylpyridine hydroxylase n=1 Tax=Cupriavidus malaysiensis TaxID=367825 RepID=A0ABM6FGY0_9BURK|nr:antitoxin Xre/MbcA/ParS toxin-binding domain-containing protein [Cupriavidus malaysiensis]AOZ11213.1 6-hydroxy-3-succinoylpyridine hydroxylase [Cupriavidus malaysiensis]